MSIQLPKYRTGDPQLDEAVRALVEQVGKSNGDDLVFEMVVTALRLARDGASRYFPAACSGALLGHYLVPAFKILFQIMLYINLY